MMQRVLSVSLYFKWTSCKLKVGGLWCLHMQYARFTFHACVGTLKPKCLNVNPVIRATIQMGAAVKPCHYTFEFLYPVSIYSLIKPPSVAV